MLGRSLLVVTALGFLLLAFHAWGAPETFACSVRDNPWREYGSRHFLVDTDVPRADAARLVTRLEKMYALVLGALMREPAEIPGRARVLAFDHPAEFRALFSDRIDGAWTDSSLGEPTIALYLVGLESNPETVAHELTHHVSRYLFPRQQQWFSEGLATFIQTVGNTEPVPPPSTGSHLVRSNPSVVGAAGAVPRQLALALAETAPVHMRDLLEWRGGDDAYASYHLYSWLLYHWLWNNRSRALTLLEARLADGDDPAEAWKASLPEFPPEDPAAMARLEKAVESYRRQGRFAFYQVKAATDAAFSEAEIACADLRMVLLGTRTSWPRSEDARAVRRTEIDLALREDPVEPVALVERATLEGGPPPLDGLREAVAVHPNDWRAWYLLGAQFSLERDGAEQEAAYRKAVALNPDYASAHGDLAWSLLAKGRAREALPFANRALDLAPWSPYLMDTLAAVAAALGQCEKALVLERRANAMTGPVGPSHEIIARLPAMEPRCKGAAPVATDNP